MQRFAVGSDFRIRTCSHSLDIFSKQWQTSRQTLIVWAAGLPSDAPKSASISSMPRAYKSMHAALWQPHIIVFHRAGDEYCLCSCKNIYILCSVTWLTFMFAYIAPAFSIPVIYSCIFRSCIFHPCDLLPHFPPLHSLPYRIFHSRIFSRPAKFKNWFQTIDSNFD